MTSSNLNWRDPAYKREYMKKYHANGRLPLNPIRVETAICKVCDNEFTYVRYSMLRQTCSDECKKEAKRRYDKARHTPKRPERTEEEKRELKNAYWRAYAKRPEVKARRQARYRERYRTDEGFRDRILDRSRRISAGKRHHIPDLTHGYVGPAFDHLREKVGQPPAWDTPWFDEWAEKMGTAILAEAEGKDVEEALKEYRKQEYTNKYLTDRFGEWESDDERFRLDKVLATENITEIEALAKIAAAEKPKTRTRWHMGDNERPHSNRGKSRTQPRKREGIREWQSGRQQQRRAKYA